MQAKETKLQDILEGTKQFIVPLFQRPYSWDIKEWEWLWKDLEELYEAEKPRTHFIGSIVSMPTVSVPEGVAKYLLIDGQQRLTTIIILLTILRDRATGHEAKEFSDEINNTLIVNFYKKNLDFFKLLPTQDDRETYFNLINARPLDGENRMVSAYKYFDKKINSGALDCERVKKIITSYLSVVSIVLDVDDNPRLVFESLNAKSRPLSQADLIRNYFFMRVHIDRQEEIYNSFWLPMQNRLKENLTDFIRHFLMRAGELVKQNDVYYYLKEKVTPENAISYLKTLYKFSKYYHYLLWPEQETDLDIKSLLTRLNRIEVTTAYPLLLDIYDEYFNGNLSKSDYIQILKVIESFLVRRFICGVPTNQLNKIFPGIFSQLKTKQNVNYVEGIKIILQGKNYPSDIAFKSGFSTAKIYGGGDRIEKAKLVLESMESHFGHKEAVQFENLSVEHIMPQTLSEWWQNHLGDDWDVTHELLLHNIGNLTLTAYNSELSNDDFSSKKDLYQKSHLELNRYFDSILEWNKEAIEKRTGHLTDIALQVWPYFGDEEIKSDFSDDATGKTPSGFWFLEQYFEVGSWRDVLEEILNAISELDTDNFETIVKQFPVLIGKDKYKFRAVRELRNGFFIEVNLSARNIVQFCYQAIEAIGLSLEDLKIEHTQIFDSNKKASKRDLQKLTPSNFQGKCIERLKKHFNAELVKITATNHETPDKKLGLVCLVSKLHENNGRKYWFCFHPRQSDFLSEHKNGHIVFGCGSEDNMIRFPLEDFAPLLGNMNRTEKDGLMWWHVHIFIEAGKYYLGQPTFANSMDITKYLID